MGEIQFEGENNYSAPQVRIREVQRDENGTSTFTKLAIKLGAKTHTQVQVVLITISVISMVLAIIIFVISL